jgi:hypothetical protein
MISPGVYKVLSRVRGEGEIHCSLEVEASTSGEDTLELVVSQLLRHSAFGRDIQRPGSGRGGASQLPAVAGGILTEHNAETVTVECRVLESRLLQPRLQGREVAFDFDRNMCPRRRAVVGILAEVDLLAVLALEPPGLKRELWGRDYPPVAEDFQEECLLALRPSNRHPEVHVMQARHGSKPTKGPAGTTGSGGGGRLVLSLPRSARRAAPLPDGVRGPDLGRRPLHPEPRRIVGAVHDSVELLTASRPSSHTSGKMGAVHRPRSRPTRSSSGPENGVLAPSPRNTSGRTHHYRLPRRVMAITARAARTGLGSGKALVGCRACREWSLKSETA